jgi:hypothetical protein
MLRTVSQLETLLSRYLGVSGGMAPSTITEMLNLVGPKLYSMGMWKGLVTEIQLDCSAGYFVLPPDYESVLMAFVNDCELPVHGQSYEYAIGAIQTPPTSNMSGAIDEGYVAIMSEVPSGGIDELIFTTTGTFVNGDTVKVTYVDSEDGRTSATLALETTTTLTPANTISSVESIVYTSLPDRTMCKDADDVIYAIMPAGDGVTAYKRYKTPQVPDDTSQTWTAQLFVKRAWIPVTAATDIVYLDNLNALRYAFQGVIADDNEDPERGERHWSKAQKELDNELAQARGGAKTHTRISPWGRFQGPVRSRYG